MHMHHYNEILKFIEEFDVLDTEDIKDGDESPQWSEDKILKSIGAKKFVACFHEFPTWAKHFTFP